VSSPLLTSETSSTHPVRDKVDHLWDRWVQGPMSPDPRYGAFQMYTVAKAVTVARIPTHISFEEACVLPVAFSTALVSLFAPAGQGFGLPHPVLDPTPSSKVVVIWGASSSVGLLALQLARAAGIKTIAISSTRNFELCASCGAGATFDYHDSSVVDDVTGAVAAAGGEFVGILDCVSMPDQSLQFCIPVLDKLGGGELGILLPHVKPHVSEKISVTNILGYNEMIFPFWKDYLTPALERGRVRCLPEALVVGSGLEALQRALDVQKEGVSAKKVVVAL